MTKLFLILTLTAPVSLLTLIGCVTTPLNEIPPVSAHGFSPVRKTMRPFESDAELRRYFKELAEKERKRVSRRGNLDAQAPMATPATAASEAKSKDDESVTNVQHAGVDEGGIVKVHGDHLVVLRRGRLFTVAIGDNRLTPISAVDAFGADIDPNGTWYDEMLVSDNTIAVIGYSYQRGGTEVGLFNIDDAGKLSYKSTYHLRSNDYYSSRNYASRLIGNKLIFYAPLYIYPGAADPFETFPAVRKWHRDARPEEFKRIVSATRIYRPEVDIEYGYGMALHTVTVCDLSGGGFQCQATAVLGPAGRVFYVSPDSVYVWATEWRYHENRSTQRSLLFRMPLDGSGPGALGVSGSPVDQFSFLQSDDQHLNVLVRSNGNGDGMWNAEKTAGNVALMRVPVMSFSDGSTSVPSSNYRKLPRPEGYTFQNRFVGRYLIYGTGSGWGAPEKRQQSNLFVVDWARGDTHLYSLVHGVDRIEQMGSDAIVIGTDGRDLHFSSLKLGDWPEVVSRYTRKEASQGELRSHGFFYKDLGNGVGTLGLPISTPARAGYRHLFDSSAAILFLRNENLRLTEVGELESRPETATNDNCKASCVDWYGNARPLFVRGRVLALLGYEIVEGTLNNGKMREQRRVNYSPGRQMTRS